MNSKVLDAINCLLYLANAIAWFVIAQRPFLALAWFGVSIACAYRIARRSP